MTKLRNILVLDIETVSQVGSFDQLSEELKGLWTRKAQFIRNEEDSTPDELYFMKSGIYAEFGKIIVIGLGIYETFTDGSMGLRVTSFQSDDEAGLLTSFTTFLNEKFDQDELVLCAHNGKEFDFPYLCRRLLINGLPIPATLNLAAKKPWEVQHIDTMELWKFGDRKNFTSLELLTHLFQIPSSKTTITGSQVNDVYYHEKEGLEKIAEYCRGDIVATAQLYLKLNNLPIVDPEKITIITNPPNGPKTQEKEN